jgi:hypothetical protein
MDSDVVSAMIVIVDSDDPYILEVLFHQCEKVGPEASLFAESNVRTNRDSSGIQKLGHVSKDRHICDALFRELLQKGVEERLARLKDH